MPDYTDALAILSLMICFFAGVGVIHALITIIGWVASHYRGSRGLRRW